MVDISKYQDDPSPSITLPELARELNAIAKLRDNLRLAFCKRIAVAYLSIVGHTPLNGSADGRKFYVWCEENLRSGTNKKYTHSALRTYLRIGLAKNPQKLLRGMTIISNRRGTQVRQIGAAVVRAIGDDTKKVVSVRKLRERMPTNVAQEVNELLRAWEHASPEARSQFLYYVTGRKIAA